MKSQLYSADRVNWLKPVTAQGALQRALRVRRQRHACVQGGASSLGCGVTVMSARTRGFASRPVARNLRNGRTVLTRRSVFLLFLIAVHAVGNLHVFKGPGDFNVFGFFLRPFVLDRLRFPGELSGGVCLVECVIARLRWFGEDLGSGAVSWIDERSFELGHHWLDVAHGHYPSSSFYPVSRILSHARCALHQPLSIGIQVGGSL